MRSSQAQSIGKLLVQHLNTTVLTTFRYLATTIRQAANCVCELRELLQVASHGLQSQRQLSPTVLALTSRSILAHLSRSWGITSGPRPTFTHAVCSASRACILLEIFYAPAQFSC
jgi:hypothetical protein